MLHFRSAMITISQWLFPKRASDIITIIFPLIVSAGILSIGFLFFRFLFIEKKEKYTKIKQPLIKLPHLLSIFFLVYLVFLIISISFFDARTPLDNRMLLPAHISVIILFLCITYKLFYVWQARRNIRIIIILTCIGLAILYSLNAKKCIIDIYENGIGYAHKMWKKSKIIQEVKNLPPEITIYTNVPEAVYFLTGRNALRFPLKLDPYSLKINSKYSYEVVKIKEKLKNKGAVLVYLNNIDRHYLLSKNELEKQLSVNVFTKVADGEIYGIK